MKLFNEQIGLSLLEIMVSIVLLALIILPMAVMFGNGAAFLRNNEIENSALVIAQRKLEEIKTLEFEDIVNGNGSVNEDGTNYMVNTVINENVNLKNITVTVNWVGVNGNNHQLQLETIVTRRW